MLKQLIQRLLNSRTTPTEAAHSAMPNVTEQVIATTDQQNWGIVAEGVAPYDCYLMAQGRATSDVSELRAWNKTADIYNQVVASRINQTQGCYVPVAKGNSWQILASNRDVTIARYISLIGGGYNLFIWRALPCLRALSNFSPRSSFLAGAIGFLISLIRPQLQFISRRIKQASGIFSFRRATAGFVLRPMPHKFCLVTENFGKVRHRQRPLIGAFQFQFQKVGQWHTCCQKTQQTRLSSLFQALAIRVNTLAGGVAC